MLIIDVTKFMYNHVKYLKTQTESTEQSYSDCPSLFVRPEHSLKNRDHVRDCLLLKPSMLAT